MPDMTPAEPQLCSPRLKTSPPPPQYSPCSPQTPATPLETTSESPLSGTPEDWTTPQHTPPTMAIKTEIVFQKICTNNKWVLEKIVEDPCMQKFDNLFKIIADRECMISGGDLLRMLLTIVHNVCSKIAPSEPFREPLANQTSLCSLKYKTTDGSEFVTITEIETPLRSFTPHGYLIIRAEINLPAYVRFAADHAASHN